jgi:hypothetical protein
LTDLIQILHGTERLIVAWMVWGLMLAVLLAAASIGDQRIRQLMLSFLRIAAMPLLWLFHFGAEKADPSGKLPSFLAGVSRIDKKHSTSNRFHSIREAKEHLAVRIADEAKRQGAPLSDIEYKMLFFSASGHMNKETSAASEIFDRDFDDEEYERKIGILVNSIEAEDGAHSPLQQEQWDDALLKLSQGDHYLSVLVGSEHLGKAGHRPPHDLRRLLLAALFCLVGWTIVMVFCDRVLGPDWNHPLRW